MKFSFFNPWPVYGYLDNAWPAPPRRADQRAASDGMQYGIEASRLADEVGFDYVTVAEHHYSPRQLSPNPILSAAVLTQHLHNAGVAVLGCTLPLVNPLRTAEEVAILDVLAKGKLLLGLFRGTPNEFLTYGTNPYESRAVFEEAVDLLLHAWTEPEAFAWVGRYFDFRTVAVWPRTVSRPHPPILVSANSPTSGAYAARNRFRMGVSFAPAPVTAKVVEHYKNAAAEAGWEPQPEDILHRSFCLVAETDEKAAELAERHGYGDLSLLFNVRDNGVGPAISMAMAGVKPGEVPSGGPGGPPKFPRRPQFMGAPDTVARQIREFVDQTGVGHLDLTLNDAQLPYEEACMSIKLFGTEVIPQFR